MTRNAFSRPLRPGSTPGAQRLDGSSSRATLLADGLADGRDDQAPTRQHASRWQAFARSSAYATADDDAYRLEDEQAFEEQNKGLEEPWGKERTDWAREEEEKRFGIDVEEWNMVQV